jgi:hypothetical protein
VPLLSGRASPSLPPPNFRQRLLSAPTLFSPPANPSLALVLSPS